MVALTERAVSKVKEIIEAQAPKPAGLRIAVVGGGCSGFSYSMNFENSPGMLDKSKRPTNPSIHARDLMIEWKGGRTNAVGESATAEPGGDGAVGCRL